MVAVEARRVREQSELAETGGFADGFYCLIFLVHLGVSYSQHNSVSRRLWQSKAAHRVGPSQVVLLVGWVEPLDGRASLYACRYLCLPDWGRQSLERCMRVSLAHNAKNYDWSRAKKSCCLCTLRSGRESIRCAGVLVTSLSGRPLGASTLFKCQSRGRLTVRTGVRDTRATVVRWLLQQWGRLQLSAEGSNARDWRWDGMFAQGRGSRFTLAGRRVADWKPGLGVG